MLEHEKRRNEAHQQSLIVTAESLFMVFARASFFLSFSPFPPLLGVSCLVERVAYSGVSFPRPLDSFAAHRPLPPTSPHPIVSTTLSTAPRRGCVCGCVSCASCGQRPVRAFSFSRIARHVSSLLLSHMSSPPFCVDRRRLLPLIHQTACFFKLSPALRRLLPCVHVRLRTKMRASVSVCVCVCVHVSLPCMHLFCFYLRAL